MSRDGFVMVLVDPASGKVNANALFKKGPPVSGPHLDSQCPLFGDRVQRKGLRIKRFAPPPVVWIDEKGRAHDLFRRSPWRLHVHSPKPGVWATQFVNVPNPDGKLHLRCARQLHTDREMVRNAWRLPQDAAKPFSGEEEEYQEFYDQERCIPGIRPSSSKETQRKDLRGKNVFTIDNDDSRDLDDALDVTRVGENHYIVGIHIADVTAFVKPGTPRDRDAQGRGTSHYFEDVVLHMLPDCLSTDLCSLSPDRDKLSVSIYFEIVVNHKKPVIKGSRIFNSLIRSRSQLTYSKVDEALSGDATGIPDDICQALRWAVSIGRSLRTGRPDNLSQPNDHGESGAMIEDFMVTANQLVGEQMARTLGTIKNAGNCCLFRSHPGPSVKDLLLLAERLAVIELLPPFDSNELLDAALSRQRKEFPVRSGRESTAFRSAALHREIRSRLLMDSDEAEYRLKALESGPGGLKIWKSARLNDIAKFSGHHGLGISRYAWFTSPIRRYPDMVNHRFLKNAIDNGSSSKTLKKVDKERMHRLIADGRAAQRAYERRRDFTRFLPVINGNKNEKISVTPLNFRWFSPYILVVEVEMAGLEIQVQFRDPETARIENHGLQCCLTPPGQPGCVLHPGRPMSLRLMPGDISPQAGCIFVKAAQWLN